MPEEKTDLREEMTKRIGEIVLNHLGIPRPGVAKLVGELQDVLLPAFMDTSRHAWLAGSPMSLPSDQSIWLHLSGKTQEAVSFR